jgi:hypothetical protein
MTPIHFLRPRAGQKFLSVNILIFIRPIELLALLSSYIFTIQGCKPVRLLLITTMTVMIMMYPSLPFLTRKIQIMCIAGR